MPTATLDTVEGSSLDYSPNENSVLVRGGIVTGLSGDPSQALGECLNADGMPPLGESTQIGQKVLFFRRLQVEPNPLGASDVVSVKLIYDTINGPNSAYTITESSFLQVYETNRLPGTRVPLLVPEWSPANTTGGIGGAIAAVSPPVPADLAMGRFEFVMSQVTIAGIKQGAAPPPRTYSGNVGGANKDAWLGLGKGMWKVVGGESTASVWSGYFSYSLSALTKNIEDWSEIRQLYDHKLGHFVKLPQSDEDKLASANYDYGIFVKVPGAIRYGPNPLINFNPLFGAILGGKAIFGANGLGNSTGTGGTA